MGLNLPKVDSPVRGLLFPDFCDVAPTFEPDPCERRCLAEYGTHAAAKFGATREVLRAIGLQSAVGAIQRETGSKPHVHRQ